MTTPAFGRGARWAALWGILVLAGCSGVVTIPQGRLETSFFLPYSCELVREACPAVLANHLLGPGGTELRVQEGMTVHDGRNGRLTICRALDGGFLACTFVQDVSGGRRSRSGRAEHWNILMVPSGRGTSVEVYRQVRRKEVAVPLSDGSRERGFVDKLSGALEQGVP